MFKKKKKDLEQNNETPVNESASREKIKKVLKIVIPLVLVLLLIFIVLKVAFGDDHNIIFGKDGIESSRQLFQQRKFVFDPG